MPTREEVWNNKPMQQNTNQAEMPFLKSVADHFEYIYDWYSVQLPKENVIENPKVDM